MMNMLDQGGIQIDEIKQIQTRLYTSRENTE